MGRAVLVGMEMMRIEDDVAFKDEDQDEKTCHDGFGSAEDEVDSW